MNFRDRACAHLSKYREKTLGLPAGAFLHRGRHLPKGHILPRQHHRHNILEPYRDQFFASDRGTTRLHRYFHHLNSSQALCINLIFPLLAENRYGILIGAMGVGIAQPIQARFEAGSTMEIAKRKTSFDFHLSSPNQDVFVEVKSTESGFGAARNDGEHRQKFAETYCSFAGSFSVLDGCLQANYQVFVIWFTSLIDRTLSLSFQGQMP